MSDLAHEVITPTSFSATAPIHAYIVDAGGNGTSLVGRVNVDRTTGAASHSIADAGTCHQTATLLGQPGAGVRAVLRAPVPDHGGAGLIGVRF